MAFPLFPNWKMKKGPFPSGRVFFPQEDVEFSPPVPRISLFSPGLFSLNRLTWNKAPRLLFLARREAPSPLSSFEESCGIFSFNRGCQALVFFPPLDGYDDFVGFRSFGLGAAFCFFTGLAAGGRPPFPLR